MQRTVMIYITRILWLIGLVPVCFIIAVWFMIEFSTIPLKMLIHFLIKGRVENMNLEWFGFVVKPCLYYLQIDLTNEEE